MQHAKNEQQECAETVTEKFHPFATAGSITERGGRVAQASSSIKIVELAIARVGDKVAYEDGSEAHIIDVAGDSKKPQRRRRAIHSNPDRSSTARGRCPPSCVYKWLSGTDPFPSEPRRDA
ncbi:hypothetical protein LMG24076_05401 [Trinickia soli]|nr:hypothetical protein LMG24076_05401 [Trinickia soli]